MIVRRFFGRMDCLRDRTMIHRFCTAAAGSQKAFASKREFGESPAIRDNSLTKSQSFLSFL